MTSPPYWGLRDYGIEPQIWDAVEGCSHEWQEHIKKPVGGKGYKCANVGANKNDFSNMRDHNIVTNFCLKCNAWRGSLGLEPTIELYIRHMIQIFDEIYRVLRDDGCLFVNLGDTYSGGNRDSGSVDLSRLKSKEAKHTNGWHIQPNRQLKDIPSKSLCQIPSRFAIAMTDAGWILRNEIIWHKPNSMPSSASDRFTIDFEKIFFFTKSQKYYFEQQFENNTSTAGNRNVFRGYGDYTTQGNSNAFNGNTRSHNQVSGNDGILQGRNKRTVWTIPTEPYTEAHFATYPSKLCETPIKAGCPEFICTKCGKAREKVFEPSEEYKKHLGKGYHDHSADIEVGMSQPRHKNYKSITAEYLHTGYTDCNCNAPFEPGIVLDPFAGSCTTLDVARRLGLRWIGIEVKQEYIEIGKKRMKLDEPDLFIDTGA
jgi:site-specific DNA-methyltransferase (adenine-specific)